MEYLKLVLDFLVSMVRGFLALSFEWIALIVTPVLFAWAFMPYQELETNAAALCFFLAVMGYWYWRFTNSSKDTGFWAMF